jgi:hypothetical protein
LGHSILEVMWHTPRSEVVPLDLQCDFGFAAPDDRTRDHQLQLDAPVERNRPVDGDVGGVRSPNAIRKALIELGEIGFLRFPDAGLRCSSAARRFAIADQGRTCVCAAFRPPS